LSINLIEFGVQLIGGSLQLYKLNNFNHPTTESGLTALVVNPSSQEEINIISFGLDDAEGTEDDIRSWLIEN